MPRGKTVMVRFWQNEPKLRTRIEGADPALKTGQSATEL
jgi:hypothetical protein